MIIRSTEKVRSPKSKPGRAAREAAARTARYAREAARDADYATYLAQRAPLDVPAPSSKPAPGQQRFGRGIK